MITIIVLLILAGLTIALVSSENGLIAKAKSAASKYAKSAAQEELELAMQTVKMDNLSKGKSITLEIFTEASGNGNNSDSGSSTSSSKYKIVPTVKASSISSLTLGYEIKEGNKTVDPERIPKVYYVCDKNADIDENMWKDSQKS